jgi:hypothetical protein
MQCMGKTEVYRWRVTRETKKALEGEARRTGESLAALLERIAREWLESSRRLAVGQEDEQARRHAAAARAFGRVSSGGPYDAERVRKVIRERLTGARDR